MKPLMWRVIVLFGTVCFFFFKNFGVATPTTLIPRVPIFFIRSFVIILVIMSFFFAGFSKSFITIAMIIITVAMIFIISFCISLLTMPIISLISFNYYIFFFIFFVFIRLRLCKGIMCFS